MMTRIIIAVTLILSQLLVTQGFSARIKDIVTIEGVRDNQILGYGLVIGLNGTGDKQGTEFTIQSLATMLSKQGIVVNPQDVKVKNVAAVIVTATLPPFIKAGSKTDVLVSSIGDATSLQGGTLLMTPLKAPNQQIYAVAQGPVSIGGFLGGKGGDTIQKNHPTAGRIPGGALVEREVKVDLGSMELIALTLNSQDFTTALRLSKAINNFLGEEGAEPVSSATVNVRVPERFRGRIVELIASIETLDVRVDRNAKVVLNERTGTIVMGEDVRISTVAISHGNLTIQIRTEQQVSQPLPFSKGQTVVVPQREVTVEEGKSQLLLVDGGVSIGEVVRALNSIGVTPRDLIAILQAMKAAGALQAEIEII
ncbi:MAG TPA: flagellar basal body P-ring protein FlgI [Nitrospiria bacterium]|nr:flagellar basal body P-ring protein FlgI [Nitrospiria bacterium]